jgi:alanyl-tRNA synthetase
MTDEQKQGVELWVNNYIFEALPVITTQKNYAEARASGAMALFGEKYGDVVRVVTIPDISAELCGGTHVRNTSEIGLFHIISESGIAAGVRRIEAFTGPGVWGMLRDEARTLEEVGKIVRASSPGATVDKVRSLVEERKTLEKRIEELMRSGGGGELDRIINLKEQVDGLVVVATSVNATDMKSLTALADSVRDQLPNGVAVLAADVNGKHTLVCVVSDDVREKGLRADEILKAVAAVAGGRGGGKAHLAQAGIPDGSRIGEALAAVVPTVRSMIESNGH